MFCLREFHWLKRTLIFRIIVKHYHVHLACASWRRFYTIDSNVLIMIMRTDNHDAFHMHQTCEISSACKFKITKLSKIPTRIDGDNICSGKKQINYHLSWYIITKFNFVLPQTLLWVAQIIKMCGHNMWIGEYFNDIISTKLNGLFSIHSINNKGADVTSDLQNLAGIHFLPF